MIQANFSKLALLAFLLCLFCFPSHANLNEAHNDAGLEQKEKNMDVEIDFDADNNLNTPSNQQQNLKPSELPPQPKVSACKSKGGYCLDATDYSCSTGFKSSMCPGTSNIKCCIGKVTRVTPLPTCSGTCADISTNTCSTGFISGRCQGSSNILCCNGKLSKKINNSSGNSGGVQPPKNGGVQPSKNSGGEQPSKLSGDDDPSNNSGEQPSKFSGEDDPSNKSGEQPTKFSGNDDPSNNSGEQPSKFSNGDNPSNNSGGVQPSKFSGGVEPSKKSGGEQPSKFSDNTATSKKSNNSKSSKGGVTKHVSKNEKGKVSGKTSSLNNNNSSTGNGNANIPELDPSSSAGTTASAGKYNNYKLENEAAHKTEKYTSANGRNLNSRVILRRFQPFKIQFPVALKADYTFTISNSKGFAYLKTIEINGMDVILSNSNPGPIGRFNIEIRDSNSKVIYKTSDIFYFIFNPFSELDEVYVSPTDLKKYGQEYSVDIDEHIWNEFGGVWKGSENSNSMLPWNYDQFNLIVLDAALEAVENFFNIQQLSSAVLVTRWYSNYIMSNIIEGKWGDDFSKGKNPSYWTSTSQIIDQFNRNNKKKIGFAQCWVFASLGVSFLRSIGIAARSVTNFNSAHPKNDDLKCIFHYKEVKKGEWEIDPSAASTASIWNYHVWVDFWLHTRTDIANGAGWQALDPTLQEPSKNGPNEYPFNRVTHMAGPVPVERLLAGDYSLSNKFDAPFMGGQSNCVLINRFRRMGESKYSEIVDKEHVGRVIKAKMPDNVCPNEKLDENGYSNACEINLSKFYSKPGTFFAELESSLANDRSLNLKTKITGSSSKKNKGEVSFSYGDTAKLEIIPPKLEKNAKLEWSISISAIDQRNDPSSRTGGSYRKFIESASGDYSSASKSSMSIIWDNQFWNNPKVNSALTKTLDFEIIYSAVQRGGKDNGRDYFHRTILSVIPPEVNVICSHHSQLGRKSTSFKAGANVSCRVTIPLPLANLRLDNVKITLDIGGQPAGRDAVKTFPTGHIIGTNDKNRKQYFDINYGILSNPTSGKVGVIATIESTKFPPFSGSTRIKISK